MFIYSLPIFFSDIQLASQNEFFLMLIAVFVVLYFIAPAPDKNWRQQPFEGFLQAAWFGGMSLQWVFWPYFIMLNASLFVTDLLAKTGKLTVSSWDEIHFVLLLTIFWWTMSIWRCSSNTDVRLWSAMARLVTILVFVEYALKLLIRIDYPRIFFNCEDMLLDYGSCF